ncbi:hypothetical protein COY87_03745 [Candidatus Roizmanbacteria bacterium CG_4_10_14_0_8_um_filter_33_9]|uniref:CopG family transcriptional regulator n=1 Tax=Candidatus Roizmanbacteria bacterium CG_4_10_14_0_8_um_filter_33_9 TaxID=1974826 RepID=A0A2M7QHX7_9BACT|nr:MAG: hypothetical protein COY87_03745 [Candidatus Roizmanbacteria bacterium CG_4_10_14_0_8_um_filter_33_9]
MLTKRTNILFDQEMWAKLSVVAKQEQTSVGDLIRKAVIKIYIDKSRTSEKQQAIDTIMAVKLQKKKLNYRDLIKYARKF